MVQKIYGTPEYQEIGSIERLACRTGGLAGPKPDSGLCVPRARSSTLRWSKMTALNDIKWYTAFFFSDRSHFKLCSRRCLHTGRILQRRKSHEMVYVRGAFHDRQL